MKRLLFVTGLSLAAWVSQASIFRKDTIDIGVCRKLLALIDPMQVEVAKDVWRKAYRLPHDQEIFSGSIYYFPDTDGVEIFTVGGLSRMRMARAAQSYPYAFAQYGVFVEIGEYNMATMRVPGTIEANRRLDNLDSTPYAKPFRFKDWFPNKWLLQEQEYSTEKFLTHIRNSQILLATQNIYLPHDRTEDHMTAILMMPPEVFERYRAEVEYIYAANEILRGVPGWNERFANYKRQIGQQWDDLTELASVELLRKNMNAASLHYRDLSQFYASSVYILTGLDVDSKQREKIKKQLRRLRERMPPLLKPRKIKESLELILAAP